MGEYISYGARISSKGLVGSIQFSDGGEDLSAADGANIHVTYTPVGEVATLSTYDLVVSNNTVSKNKGWLTENGGTSAAITTGGTIAHGLPGTPTIFSAVPTGAATDVYVTANATNLIVTFGGGGSVAFSWRAAMQNSM